MVHTIEFQKALGLLYIHYQGVLTDDALLQAFQEDLAAIRSHPVKGVIVDLTDISRFTLQSQTNVALAESASLPSSVRLVFVAPCDIQFGMARMFELSSDVALSSRIRVVRQLAEAYAELGVAAPVAC